METQGEESKERGAKIREIKGNLLKNENESLLSKLRHQNRLRMCGLSKMSEEH
jgi:hypothetical protein